MFFQPNIKMSLISCMPTKEKHITADYLKKTRTPHETETACFLQAAIKFADFANHAIFF
jgi:hypothetical protein